MNRGRHRETILRIRCGIAWRMMSRDKRQRVRKSGGGGGWGETSRRERNATSRDEKNKYQKDNETKKNTEENKGLLLTHAHK